MPESLAHCPYCGSKEIYVVWEESNFNQCVSCLLYFRNPMPTQEELERLYQRSWSVAETARSETGGTDLDLAYVFAHKLARSLKRRDLHSVKLLDFGAGRGAMLYALRASGARVCGVEPFGFGYLQSKGFEVYRNLSDVHGVWDGITMIDVFYVATANPLGLNARINKGRWREARKEGHLFFPHPSTMERILREAGFRRVKRLIWLVRYHRNPIRVTANYFMQATGLDGELRYLAWT